MFLLLIADDVTASRGFYERHFGFTPVFVSKVYAQLMSPEHDGRRFSLAFMPADHPFGVVPQRAAAGDGLMLTIQSADVNALHARLLADGVPIVHGPRDEPWGQRRFVVRDPGGTYVDVVQPIEPEPGWYARFE
ncbi:MAG: VOC family protein [Methylobacteriaceae bacterium]|nr:VOC family protein [Methylobacteriaceae bacterium]